MNVDLSTRATQLRANKLALYGGALFQIAGDELRELDAVTLDRHATWNVMPGQLCVTQDRLVVLASRGSGACTVYRLGRRRELETFAGPILSYVVDVVVPGRSADEIYVSVGDHLAHLALHGTEAEELPRLPHPAPNGIARAQLFGRGDGSIVGSSGAGGISIVSPTGAVRTLQTPDRLLAHVVPATGDRLWYSYCVLPHAEFVQHLVLTSVETPMTELARLDVAPGRIVHTASGGGAAAVLVVEPGQPAAWSIVVVDEGGGVRWRARIPDAELQGVNLTAGFVAIDEHRVVLAGRERALASWDAATGRR